MVWWSEDRWWMDGRWCWIDNDWLSQYGITMAVESHKQPMLNKSIEYKNRSKYSKDRFLLKNSLW